MSQFEYLLSLAETARTWDNYRDAGMYEARAWAQAGIKALPPATLPEVTRRPVLDAITARGSAVKAVGDGWVSGYLVRYGGGGDLSPFRDVFTKATDFGRRRESTAWVHHGMLPGLGEQPLTHEAQLTVDDVGVFCKLLLDMRSKYEAALYGLVQAGKLGWSSGTLPNLVKRERRPDGAHTVKRWILGLDASLTPAPAGGLEVNVSAMKSLLTAAGLDALEAQARQLATRPDGVRYVTDHRSAVQTSAGRAPATARLETKGGALYANGARVLRRASAGRTTLGRALVELETERGERIAVEASDL